MPKAGDIPERVPQSAECWYDAHGCMLDPATGAGTSAYPVSSWGGGSRKTLLRMTVTLLDQPLLPALVRHPPGFYQEVNLLTGYLFVLAEKRPAEVLNVNWSFNIASRSLLHLI